MADLNRLRGILMSGDAEIIMCASVLYHLTPRPTEPANYTPFLASSVLQWASTAPVTAFGSPVGDLLPDPSQLGRMLDNIGQQGIAAAASLANAMYTPDHQWDKHTRDHFSTMLTDHGPDVARTAAQSSAEFAALDAITDSGYSSVQHATNEVALVRKSSLSTFYVITRQFQRSRHAIVCTYTDEAGNNKGIITPWCLSRQNAHVFVAVALRFLRAKVRQERASRIAATATSYMARAGIESVRRVLEPAIAIMTTFDFDSTKLSFVDSSGRVRESIQTRTPAVLAAFSAIMSSGTKDVLLSLASARASLVPAEEMESDDVLSDYSELVDNQESAVLLFSRVLAKFRRYRDVSVPGPRVNKDPMLGYITRGISMVERNTAACMGRFQEMVSLARSGGASMARTLVFIEWGGGVNYPLILAAAASTKIDVAIDIGASGIDLPGHDTTSDDDDPMHCIQFLLSSAQERGLPRMPTVNYSSSATIMEKLSAVKELYSFHSDDSMVFVSGGAVRDEGVPVSICADASARINAMREVHERANLIAGCAEALVPPLCPHGEKDDPQNFVLSLGLSDPDCPLCKAQYRSVALIARSCELDDVRITKPRSSYAHNGHVSLEFIPAPKTNLYQDTLATIDSMVAANILRNRDWGDEPVIPIGGGNPTSKILADTMSPVVGEAYALLSGGDANKKNYEDLESVAQSLH